MTRARRVEAPPQGQEAWKFLPQLASRKFEAISLQLKWLLNGRITV